VTDHNHADLQRAQLLLVDLLVDLRNSGNLVGTVPDSLWVPARNAIADWVREVRDAAKGDG
jgi:hypothetical protein